MFIKPSLDCSVKIYFPGKGRETVKASLDRNHFVLYVQILENHRFFIDVRRNHDVN